MPKKGKEVVMVRKKSDKGKVYVVPKESSSGKKEKKNKEEKESRRA